MKTKIEADVKDNQSRHGSRRGQMWSATDETRFTTQQGLKDAAGCVLKKPLSLWFCQTEHQRTRRSPFINDPCHYYRKKPGHDYARACQGQTQNCRYVMGWTASMPSSCSIVCLSPGAGTGCRVLRAGSRRCRSPASLSVFRLLLALGVACCGMY